MQCRSVQCTWSTVLWVRCIHTAAILQMDMAKHAFCRANEILGSSPGEVNYHGNQLHSGHVQKPTWHLKLSKPLSCYFNNHFLLPNWKCIINEEQLNWWIVKSPIHWAGQVFLCLVNVQLPGYPGTFCKGMIVKNIRYPYMLIKRMCSDTKHLKRQYLVRNCSLPMLTNLSFP